MRWSATWLVALVVGCSSNIVERVSVEGRDDLELLVQQVKVKDGHTDTIMIEVPENAASMLMEVRGQQGGFYYLDSFVAPNKDDLAESGEFVTRSAREVAGLVDFLYPNNGTELKAGTYEVVLRAQDRNFGAGKPLAFDDLEIRTYITKKKTHAQCALHLDFLVDASAIDAADYEEAVDTAVAHVDSIYRQVGIHVEDYQIQQINLKSSDIDVGSRSALAVADDALAQARDQGSARQNSIHVLLVRTIGGSDNPNFNPAGYSMGLPGPYDADRPNATVLVASEQYAEGDDGVLYLDVPGLSSSLAHEIGHFLGLYHTSEGRDDKHDPIEDTPECSGSGCSSEFLRNIMTSAFWLNAAFRQPSDRDLFSPMQGEVMRRHPLCVPVEPTIKPEPKPKTCDQKCDAPQVCSLTDGDQMCREACDPDKSVCECKADELGVFVCMGSSDSQ